MRNGRLGMGDSLLLWPSRRPHSRIAGGHVGKRQVKVIPKYAITTVQHAVVKRQQMRAPVVPTEARSVAALALLCVQNTDYQAVGIDTLLALACWTSTARVEYSLAPLENSR